MSDTKDIYIFVPVKVRMDGDYVISILEHPTTNQVQSIVNEFELDYISGETYKEAVENIAELIDMSYRYGWQEQWKAGV